MNIIRFTYLVLLIAAASSWAKAADMHFDELHVGGPVEVILVNNNDSAGRVRCDVSAAIDVRRAANTLFVVAQSAPSPVGRVSVTIYAGSELRVIEVSGRAKLSADSLRSSSQLSIVASGAASLTVNSVAAANVNVSMSGSGTINVSGPLTASTVNFSLVGSGKIKADYITASRLTVSQRGSGKMLFGGSAKDCDAVGRGTGTIDLRGLVAGAMELKLFGDGKIFYPAGVHTTLSGDTDRIIQVKPYQPL